MSWAKFDDRYDDNRKIRRAWRRNRAAVGLHAMAITHSARHDTNGVVDIDWVEDRLPQAKEREAVLSVLLDLGLFVVLDEESFRIHDYEKFQGTPEERDARRRDLSEKRSAAGRKGAEARWASQTDGNLPMANNGKPIASEWQAGMAKNAPDPTRPDPTNGIRDEAPEIDVLEALLKDQPQGSTGR